MSTKTQSALEYTRGAVFLSLTAVVLPVVLFSHILTLVAPGVPGA